MTESICPLCHKPIEPGERLLSWFTKDAYGFTTDRGAVHVECERENR